MKDYPNHRVAIIAILLVIVACSDPESSGDSVDAGDIDISDDGGLVDAEKDGDVDEAQCTAPPAPTMGDTPTAEQWLVDASQCGQPSFAMVEDSAMGDVVDFGQSRTFTALDLEALAEIEDIILPREFEYDSQVQVFSYLTQDRGEVIEATALLAHPITTDPDFEPSAPVLFLHGTVGFNDECAPSTSLEAQLLAAVLASMGYTVVAPDFIGLKSMGDPTGFLHPYLVGQPTALASLDALRALYKMPAQWRGDHCYPHEYVSFGGSQGGHAALWIDRLATTYAPELEHLGSVATVPPADLTTQVKKALQESISATANTSAFFGASASWYGLEDRLDEIFKSPLDTLIPEVFADSCSFGAVTDNYEELEDIFRDELLASVESGDGIPEPWGCMLDHNGLMTTDIERHGPFLDSYATLFVLGEEDNLVDTPIERDSFNRLCEQGMPLAYLECAGGPHGATTAWALPEVLDFIDQRQQRIELSDETRCVINEPVLCQGTPD